MRITLIIGLLIFLLCSCSEDRQKLFLSSFDKQETKESEEIPFETDSLRRPYLMEYSNGYLYFVERNEEEMLSIFDVFTGKLVKRLCNKGLGPNDFIWITSIDIHNNKVMLFDSNAMKIRHLEGIEGDATQIKNSPAIKLHTDSIFNTAFKVFSLSDSSYIASGIIKNAHWGIIDSSGFIKNTFETYPEDPNLSRILSENEAAIAYQGRFILNPQKTKAVSVYSSGIIIRFYDIPESGVPARIKEYIYNYPQYINSGDDRTQSITFSENNLTSFIDVKGSSNYCFMLYSGLTALEASKGTNTWYSADKLLIYDWNGIPRKMITLSDRYKMFAINAEKRVLYLFKENKDTSKDDYSISILDLSKEYKTF